MIEEPRIKDKGYNGNLLLKKKNVEIEWSPELVEEYIECARNPVHFVERYMKVINLDTGLVDLKLYDYQKEMLESMVSNRFTIITTARQAGKSTVTCAAILWYILFHSEKTVALLANKADTAREILGKVQLAYQHLPKWLQQGVLEWNKGSMVLENNSRVLASATSASAIRGYSINMLIIDEAAHIDNWEEFFTSVFPTISAGKETKTVLVSTPNGLNHFYDIWNNAQKRKNQYNPIEVPWHRVPGRDQKWYNDTLAGLNFDTEKFEQEYNCSFQGSSGTLIAGWKLKELINDIKVPIRRNDGLVQYILPKEANKYAIVVDVARGKGLDYSAFSVVDITKMPYEQVCVFKSNTMLVPDYAVVVHQIAKLYNDSYVLVEINDIGEQVAYTLHDMFEYENILYTRMAGRIGKTLSSSFSGTGSQADMGVRTTKPVRNSGCSMLKMLVEQNQLLIWDNFTVSELSTFSKNGDKYEAEEGKHDDIVLGLVLFGWMTNQPYFKELTDINTFVSLRDKSEDDIMNDIMPFGFVDNGRLDVLTNEEKKAGWIMVGDDSSDNSFL